MVDAGGVTAGAVVVDVFFPLKRRMSVLNPSGNDQIRILRVFDIEVVSRFIGVDALGLVFEKDDLSGLTHLLTSEPGGQHSKRSSKQGCHCSHWSH